MTLMTQVEYAHHIKKTKQYVGKLVKKGKIPLTADKKIDSDVADAALKGNADPARSQIAESAAEKETYTYARTKREVLKSNIEEMKFKRAAGELVEVSQIESVLKDLFRDLRSRLQSLPTNVKGRLVSMHDEREIQIYLNDEIRMLLDDISNRALEKVDHVRAGA